MTPPTRPPDDGGEVDVDFGAAHRAKVALVNRPLDWWRSLTPEYQGVLELAVLCVTMCLAISTLRRRADEHDDDLRKLRRRVSRLEAADDATLRVKVG